MGHLVSNVIEFPNRTEPPTIESLEQEIAWLHAVYSDRILVLEEQRDHFMREADEMNAAKLREEGPATVPCISQSYHAVKEYLWLDAAAGGFGQPMRVHKAKGNMIEAHDTLAEYLVRYQKTMNLSDCICGPAPSPLMNCPVHGATCTACGEVWDDAHRKDCEVSSGMRLREWFRWMRYAWKLGSWRIDADIAELRGENIPSRPRRPSLLPDEREDCYDLGWQDASSKATDEIKRLRAILKDAENAGLDEFGWDSFDWGREAWEAYERFREALQNVDTEPDSGSS